MSSQPRHHEHEQRFSAGMPGQPKPSAREAFDFNIADAETLVLLADALRNKRVRRMRQELRERLGEALGVRRRDRDELDCIESEDLFAVFPLGSRLDREAFEEKSLRPLLRQALVAGCSALETFVADRVMELYRSALDAEERPSRLLDLPMTVGDWLWIDETYERKRWGLRDIVEQEVRFRASPAPSRIGELFAVVGERKVFRRVDGVRGTDPGDTEVALDRIYERRNRIAHTGDRIGRGRATISTAEVSADLGCIIEAVDAIHRVTS